MPAATIRSPRSRRVAAAVWRSSMPRAVRSFPIRPRPAPRQDGDGANSPYTAALLKVGREEDLPIEQALKRVRLAVNEATGKQQLPWESSSLTSEFSFFPSERGIAV